VTTEVKTCVDVGIEAAVIDVVTTGSEVGCVVGLVVG
jgi:hypothetical protein